MKAWQQALYVLASIGLIRTIRERHDAAKLVIPVAVLGGFLYHMIFEAKSQYIYVYALYLVPAAAYGLCTIGDRIRARRKLEDADEAAS